MLQSLNTPAWYQNDWSNDQVFLFWQVKVDPATYASAFIPFSKKDDEKNEDYYHWAIFIKNKEFTHFIWLELTMLQRLLIVLNNCIPIQKQPSLANKLMGFGKL